MLAYCFLEVWQFFVQADLGEMQVGYSLVHSERCLVSVVVVVVDRQVGVADGVEVMPQYSLEL